MSYIKHKDLGFVKENILILPMQEEIGKSFDAFKTMLLQRPDILAVSAGSEYPAGVTWICQGGVDWKGKSSEKKIQISGLTVEKDFIDTFGIELQQGRNFEKGNTADRVNYMINEAAVREMGLDAPIGKSFSFFEKRKAG